jgi:hypothetical protein
VLHRDINWHLIALAVLVPLPVAVGVAWPLWKRRDFIIGNALALGVLLVSCLIFGGAEYVDGLRFRLECEAGNLPCRKSSDFMRISTFAFIAMAQAMALFVLSGVRERRVERGHYDSRWR